MPQKVVADIVIGILAIVVNLCCAGVAGLMFFALGLVNQMEPADRDAGFILEYSAQLAIFGVLMLIGSFMLIVAGAGIIASKKWGFVLAIAGAAFLVISLIVGKVIIPSQQMSQTEEMIDLVSDIIYFASCLLFGIYSALRLGGTIGPKPT